MGIQGKEGLTMFKSELGELYSQILNDTISALCAKADELNYDRDSFIKAFAEMLETISVIATFEYYGKELRKCENE